MIDPTAGTFDEQIIDGLAVEFPTFNEDYLGAWHRYQYAVSFPGHEGFGGYGVVKEITRPDASRRGRSRPGILAAGSRIKW